jgi:hypothetical protein
LCAHNLDTPFGALFHLNAELCRWHWPRDHVRCSDQWKRMRATTPALEHVGAAVLEIPISTSYKRSTRRIAFLRPSGHRKTGKTPSTPAIQTGIARGGQAGPALFSPHTFAEGRIRVSPINIGWRAGIRVGRGVVGGNGRTGLQSQHNAISGPSGPEVCWLRILPESALSSPPIQRPIRGRTRAFHVMHIGSQFAFSLIFH